MASILNPPQKIIVTVDGSSVVIAWSAPLGDSPKYYIIFKDGKDIAKVAGDTLTYTEKDVESGTYIYSVVASYSEGESDAVVANEITVGSTEEVDEPSDKEYVIIDVTGINTDGDGWKNGSPVDIYILAPNVAVSTLKDLYFRKVVGDGDDSYEEEVALTMDVTPEFNDYSNAKNLSQLKNIWKFRGVADAILSIAYGFCEFKLNTSVEGMQITADDTGFLFESKYFVSNDSFVNYQTAIKLYTERFLTLKRQRYLWNYNPLMLNDLSADTFNFFTFPAKG